jgi:hypothetical protein
MQDPTRAPENLLVLLFRFAHRQQENFTTESFAHLLQHLIDGDPPAAARVLDWLTETLYFSQRGSRSSLSVRTQDHTDENGIPDIRIEADDVDVIVEVKLGGDVTFDQLAFYSKECELRQRTCRVLVALLGCQPMGPLPDGTIVRLWADLGVKLREEARSSESKLIGHLIDQFAGLLNHLQLMPLQVRSRLSEELSAHQQWADTNPEQPSIFRTRIKSVDRLKDMPHTEPLRNVLLQMERVLAKASGVKSHKFDSGPNMADPWIGFNVNDFDYFFCVSLGEPEQISLERYRHSVDRRWFDGSFGRLDPSTPNGLTRWSATLDLLEPGLAFFDADEVEQERKLAAFFERAFAFGERLPTVSQTTAWRAHDAARGH